MKKNSTTVMLYPVGRDLPKLTMDQRQALISQLFRSSPWIWQVVLNKNGSIATIYEIASTAAGKFENTDNCPEDPEQNW